MSLEHLYLLVALKMIDQMQSLTILSAVRHTKDDLQSDYPSWIPHWNVKSEMIKLGSSPGLGRPCDADLRSETGHEAIISPSIDGLNRQLRLRGMIVARVHSHGNIINRGQLNRKSDIASLNPVEAA